MTFLFKLKFHILIILFFLVALLTSAFFISNERAWAEESEESDYENLTLTEVMYDPFGNNSDHAKWLEVWNSGEEYIFETSKYGDLYKLTDFYVCEPKSDGLCNKRLLYAKTATPKIEADGFLIIATDIEKFSADYPFSGLILKCSTMSISSTGEKSIGLCYKDDGHCFNLAKYSDYYNLKTEGHTLEKIDFAKDNAKNNWQESFLLGGTPGNISSEKPEEEETDNITEETKTTGNIILSEIFPNPKDEDEEYIELYNPEDFNINLENWTLRDASKTGKYTFPKNSIIQNNNYFLIKKEQYKFALNNSDEAVFLSDKDRKEIARLSYENTKEELSFGLDGSSWRWSKFLTPGKENQFEDLPKFNLKKDKEIFAGIWTQFEAGIKHQKNYKYRWDFGDGHKSYLKNPRHKYKKSGKYKLRLEIIGQSEDIEKEIKIEVKKFPKEKIEIIALSPNPKGRDSEFEWIEIKNNSKKKINLKGWSIATGTKKLINHPIRKNFIIPKGKSKKITRRDSAFSLNNSTLKIELRAPDGKTAQKINYNRENNKISEDEVYEKVGKKWQWRSVLSVEVVENDKGVLGVENIKDVNAIPPLPLGEDVRRTGEGETLGAKEILTQEERIKLEAYIEERNWKRKNKQFEFLFWGTKITKTNNLFDYWNSIF